MKARQIIHVDMDAFFASVEQLDRPELKGQAVIVGGAAQRRGVVSAASYEARKFGVHSAMPMARAIRLCPQAIVLPVRMERYAQVSCRIMEIFKQFSPVIEPVSIDEAFLDVSSCGPLLGSGEDIGRAIKKTIWKQVGLTASLGLAPNKFLAKLASDLKKPDGFVVITDQNKQAILDPLPVSKIWGVGQATSEALGRMGIDRIGQLRQRSVKELQAVVGNFAEELLRLAQGIDDRPVEPCHEAKSYSSEKTFARDIQDRAVLEGVLHDQVEEVARRLRRHRLKARVITIKFRYGDFRTITRRIQLDQPTATTAIIWQQAKGIFERWRQASAEPLRLLGVALSELVENPGGQLFLFCDDQEKKQQKIDSAVDAIKARYGNEVMRAGNSAGIRKPTKKSKADRDRGPEGSA